MHKHKQSQCKRKVKHRKNLMGLIIFCITVCIVFMFAYYQNLRKEISVRQEWLETVLTREKKWILENQGPEGEIYMNGSKAGDVNPYFACMAALGLLAETKNCPITETEKKAVGRYLDWHTCKVWINISGFTSIHVKFTLRPLILKNPLFFSGQDCFQPFLPGIYFFSQVLIINEHK